VKIIRAQIEALREMLRAAQDHGLRPEEQEAFWEVARAFVELDKAWHELFGG
jgi:hypothetical protein